MTYATSVALFSKQVIGYVKMTLDRCNNTFSNAPCTATGTVCHYSYGTCKDKANYDPTTRDYVFQSKNAPLLPIAGVRPYLLSHEYMPTTLNPDAAVTVSPRMEFTFCPDWGDHMPLTPMDHDKGTGFYRTETTGEYWKNLFTRNPNARKRPIYYYEGFPGDTESSLQLKFTGEIHDFRFNPDGTVTVIATDNLKALVDATVPNAISSTNVTTLEMDSTDTTINVVDASEFKFLPHDLYCMSDTGSTMAFHHVEKDTASAAQEWSKTSLNRFGDFSYNPLTDRAYTIWASGTSTYLYSFERDGLNTPASIGATTLSGAGGVAYDMVNNVLYATDGLSVSDLHTVDMTTGSSVLVAATLHNAIRGLAHDPVTGTLYGVTGASGLLLSINTSTGSSTAIGTAINASGTKAFYGLAFDKVDSLLYTISSGTVYSFTTTGTGTSIGATSISSATGLDIIPYQESYIKIEDSDALSGNEYLSLTKIDTTNNQLTVIRRGLFGSSTYSHGLSKKLLQVAPFCVRSTSASPTGINPAMAAMEILQGWMETDYSEMDRDTWLTEMNDWYPSVRVRRIIEKPIKAATLVNQLRQVMTASIFQGEDGKVTLKAFHPINQHTETLSSFTSAANILQQPAPEIDANGESQKTQIVVYYDPVNPSDETDKNSDYGRVFVLADADTETDNNFGETFAEVIHHPWIYQEADAKRMARQRLRRFKLPAAKYRVAVDRKDYSVKTGDVVQITAYDFLSASGDPQATNFQVIQKQEFLGEGEAYISLQLMDAKIDRTYGFIGHSGAADWTAATATEKYHAYIGSASDSLGVVMSDGTQGYFIW